MSVYKVTSRTRYRGHTTGTVFEAVIDPDAELRALKRGQIELVDSSTPELEEGSYTRPRRQTSRARGASTGTKRKKKKGA